MNQVYYSKGYKYQLREDLAVQTSVIPLKPIDTEYIKLSLSGVLFIKKGYASDGASGFTYDSKSSMRGAFMHDALYQLLRIELLPQEMRDTADKEAYRIWVEDGMWKFRAWAWLKALQIGGASAANPENKKEVLIAP